MWRNEEGYLIREEMGMTDDQQSQAKKATDRLWGRSSTEELRQQLVILRARQWKPKGSESQRLVVLTAYLEAKGPFEMMTWDFLQAHPSPDGALHLLVEECHRRDANVPDDLNVPHPVHSLSPPLVPYTRHLAQFLTSMFILSLLLDISSLRIKAMLNFSLSHMT